MKMEINTCINEPTAKTATSQGYKTFSCSTQMNMKLTLRINVKMPASVGIFTFIIMVDTESESFKARKKS